MIADMKALVASVRDFVPTEVLPIEYGRGLGATGGEERPVRLGVRSRAAELLAPQTSIDCGALGPCMTEREPVCGGAGSSLFDPVALNVNAPDEGNVDLVDQIASTTRRERYLRPLVAGGCRSTFEMADMERPAVLVESGR